jgi:hypothetical protein
MLAVKNVVATKLCRLSSFLHHASQEFENVAERIKDKKIRMSVRSVALRTRQYLQELNSQKEMLRVKCAIATVNYKRKNPQQAVRNISDKKIIELCCNSEVFFSNAYNSVLNEYFPFKPLRDMLRYQLTGIRNTFRQLKLLNSVMTTQVFTDAAIL